MKAGLNRRMWTGEATYGRIAAQGAWELRLFGNDGALITRNAIYTEPPCAELLSRDAAPVIARGQTLWKLFPLTFLPPLFPSSLDPRGGGRRRQRFGATIKPLADGSIHCRGNCPAEVKRGAVWKMCCIAEMGIPAVYFPEMFVAIERRGGGKEGTNDGSKYWISINPFAVARTIQRWRINDRGVYRWAILFTNYLNLHECVN